MKKTQYMQIVLLLIIISPIPLTISAYEIIVPHSNYFSDAIVSADNLQASISGLPDNNKIQVQLGARKLVSNTPVSVRKISNTTFLFMTQLEYEISSNIFTWYSYKDAYPNSKFVKSDFQWLYLRTSRDFEREGQSDFPIKEYKLNITYNEIKLGDLNQDLGFQGYLDFNFSLYNNVPKKMIFNDLEVSIDTIDYYSVLTSAVIKETSINPIGQYNEYYNQNSKVELTATSLSRISDSYNSKITGEISLAEQIQQLGIYVDGDQPIYSETPYDCEQSRLGMTIGQDLSLSNLRSFISIQPDITLRKQNIVGRVIREPYSLDIDIESGIIFSPAKVINSPTPITKSEPRVLSIYVQNYNFKNTYLLRFMAYSTLQIASLNGTTIELGEPLLNIGDRYIDISFKGSIGADVTYGQRDNPINRFFDFFKNIFGNIGGMIVSIILLIALAAIGFILIKNLPLIIKGINKKIKKKSQNKEEET